MKEKRNDTTTRLIATAADLFSGRAYSDVSVDQIAQQAGVTKMTFYQHFHSKDEIALECLRMRLHRREEILDSYLEAIDPKVDRLLAVFDWLEQWLDPNHFKGCAFIKAVNELSADLPQVREIALDAKLRIRGRFASMARSTGHKRSSELAKELALLFEGAQSLALIESSTQPARVAKQIATILLRS